MNINNSFNMMSFNLGAAPDDYELLLLGSFFDPINDYQTKWWANQDVDEPKDINKESLAKNTFYLNEIAFQKILDTTPELKTEWETISNALNKEWSDTSTTINEKWKSSTSNDPEKAVENFIKEKEDALVQFTEKKKLASEAFKQSPQIKNALDEFYLALLDRATLTEPTLKNFIDSNTKNKSAQEIADYKKILVKNPEVQKVMAKQFLAEIRNDAEENMSTLIEKNLPDVIFLQEVANENRRFVSEFKTKNYAFSHFESKEFGTAIALNQDRFDNINKYSKIISTEERTTDTKGRGKDCAICVATDKNTGKRFAFVSAHVPGFSYQLTGEQLLEKAKFGNIFCMNLLDQLEEIKKTEAQNKTPIDAILIGSDVNASPEKLAGRFKLFTKKGFDVNRTSSPTNVHFMDENDKVREIDYFFSRIHQSNSLFSRVKRYFGGGDKIKVTAKVFPNVGFDMKNLMSDHKPIVGKVTVITKTPLSQRIRKNSFFRSYKTEPKEK